MKSVINKGAAKYFSLFQTLREKMFQRDYSKGQSTLEFAIVLPFLMVIILAVCQIGYFVYMQNLVEHAAHESARIIATTNSEKEAYKSACSILKNGSQENIIMSIHPESRQQRKTGDIVTIDLEFNYRGIAGILELINGGSIKIKSSCCMRMECR